MSVFVCCQPTQNWVTKKFVPSPLLLRYGLDGFCTNKSQSEKNMNILEVEDENENYADKLTEKEKTSNNFLNLNTEVIKFNLFFF